MLIFLVTFGVVVLDQFSKILVRLLMNVGDTVKFIPHIMNFTYVENRGAAFGMLEDKRWIFMIVSTVTIGVIIWFLRKYGTRHILLTLSLCFILGGGIGNMIDRLFVTNQAGENVVTDFLEFAFVNFAVFNIADSFVTIGAVMLGVYVLFIEPIVEKALKNKKENTFEEESDDNEDNSSES